MTYQSIKVVKGRGGWGAGLTLTPTDSKKIVLSVTSGGIHPVAAKIAELSGAEAVDGFTNQVPDAQVMCAVINCGGTARIGVYPRKRIPTVDVYPGEPGGPLAQFITEDIFVSAVTPNEVTLADEAAVAAAAAAPASGECWARNAMTSAWFLFSLKVILVRALSSPVFSCTNLLGSVM